MDVSEKKIVAGYEPVFVACANESCMIEERQFWIASILGLTWPFRFFVWSNTGTAFLKVTKNIFVSHLNNKNVNALKIIDNPSTCIEVESNDFVVNRSISVDHLDLDCVSIFGEGLKNVLHHFKTF